MVNGVVQDMPEGISAQELIRRIVSNHTKDFKGIAMAVDGEVLGRSLWESTTLAEGQNIEVVHATQGG